VIGQDQKRKGGQGHPVAVVVAAAAAGKGHHQRGSQGQIEPLVFLILFKNKFKKLLLIYEIETTSLTPIQGCQNCFKPGLWV
jgi:hypothetical protein